MVSYVFTCARRLYWVITVILGLVFLNALFGIVKINIHETLLLKYGVIKKLPVSIEGVIVRDFKIVNPGTKRCSSRGGRLLLLNGGGLGNLMFQYASTSSIAGSLGMHSVLPDYSELLSIFKLKPDVVEVIATSNYTKIQESHGCAFDPTVFDLPCGQELFVCCYLQSWKYFQGYEHEIRSQFVFNTRVENLSHFYWDTVVLPAANRRGNVVTFIAVHVRRGDKASNPKFIANGNTVASKEYLLHGYEFFLKKFGDIEAGSNNNNTNSNSFQDSLQGRTDFRNIRNVLFVVCSDDIPWARHVLPNDISVFVESGVAEVDMSVLSRCNHTLMTVGTFGWWVSWLVDGVTLYYKHMFKPGTFLAKQFNNSLDDWALPSWIPME